MLLVTIVCVVFPISLLKDVMGSVAKLSQLAVFFYFGFFIFCIFRGLPRAMAPDEWMPYAAWWRPEGLPGCMPIVSAALTAQTQFFIIYQNAPNPSVRHMDSIIHWACLLVILIYGCVGFFGCASHSHGTGHRATHSHSTPARLPDHGNADISGSCGGWLGWLLAGCSRRLIAVGWVGLAQLCGFRWDGWGAGRRSGPRQSAPALPGRQHAASAPALPPPAQPHRTYCHVLGLHNRRLHPAAVAVPRLCLAVCARLLMWLRACACRAT